MLYIRKGPPKISVAQKTAEIKRSETWKNLPDDAPEDKEEASKYTAVLRDMFEQFPKYDIRETVIKEQHGLCCYCMRKIANSGDEMRIEHWYPLNMDKRKAIEYSNFLGACTGVCSDRYSEFQCCDNSKKGEVIKLDPQNQSMMDQIKYKSDGEIYFESSPAWSEEEVKRFEYEINEVLYLNGSPFAEMMDSNSSYGGASRQRIGCNELKSRRESIIRACKDRLLNERRKNQSRSIPIATVQKWIDDIESTEEYPEYAGVMLFYYKRWLKNHKR